MKVNSKKGFTVVELVVAMAIILIVSATAVAIVNAQNTVYLRTAQTVEATNMAENAIECFRWAEENPQKNANDEDDVVATFLEVYAKTWVDLNNDENTNKYFTETSGMTVTITVTSNEITFVAKDIQSGKMILEEKYTR